MTKKTAAQLFEELDADTRQKFRAVVPDIESAMRGWTDDGIVLMGFLLWGVQCGVTQKAVPVFYDVLEEGVIRGWMRKKFPKGQHLTETESAVKVFMEQCYPERCASDEVKKFIAELAAQIESSEVLSEPVKKALADLKARAEDYK